MLLKAVNLKENLGVAGNLSVKGMITQVYPYNSSETGNYGPWSLQNVVIKDDTGIMNLCFKNKEKVSQDAIGKEVEITCYEGDRGFSGVKVDLDKQKNVKVSITATANVKYNEITKPSAELQEVKPEVAAPEPKKVEEVQVKVADHGTIKPVANLDESEEKIDYSKILPPATFAYPQLPEIRAEIKEAVILNNTGTIVSAIFNNQINQITNEDILGQVDGVIEKVYRKLKELK